MQDKTGLGLKESLRRVFALAPEQGAVEFKGEWYSWGALDAIAREVDRLLTAAGLPEGAAVGILLRNRPEHLGAYLGVLLSGRCVVTLNPFQAVEQIARDLAALSLPVLIGDADDWEHAALTAAAHRDGTLGIALGKRAVGLQPGLETLGAGPHHDLLPGTCMLMLSSGTTGPAKRIPLRYTNFERAVMSVAFYEAGSASGEITLKRSISFAPTPLVHIGGVWTILSNIVVGRAVVLFEKFNVPEWHQALVRHRPKLVSMPPAAIRMVLDARLPKEDLSSLIAVRSGSAPLDPALSEAFEEAYGCPVLDSYGATEFGGGVAGWVWEDHQRFGKVKRGSVGRANKGCSLRVVHPQTFAELNDGIGLLEVKSPQVGSGEWVRTTDLAEIDADGFVYIRGRSDDVIIRGGFKVSPQAVANVLRSHPAVGDASVIGMPDERLGAVPVAAVEPKPGVEPPTPEDLDAFLRKQLVAYQVPVRILVLDVLPRTNSMKVSQPELTKIFQGVLQHVPS